MRKPLGKQRRPLLRRIVPVLAALAIVAWFDNTYGRRPVELIFSLPADLLVPQSASAPSLSVRVKRADGKLVVGLEANGGPGTHTVVVHTRLPRGKFSVEAWLASDSRKLSAQIDYHGEDALEVPLAE